MPLLRQGSVRTTHVPDAGAEGPLPQLPLLPILMAWGRRQLLSRYGARTGPLPRSRVCPMGPVRISARGWNAILIPCVPASTAVLVRSRRSNCGALSTQERHLRPGIATASCSRECSRPSGCGCMTRVFPATFWCRRSWVSSRTTLIGGLTSPRRGAWPSMGSSSSNPAFGPRCHER